MDEAAAGNVRRLRRERNGVGGMSRLGNCLQMLFVLQARNGGIVKVSELAERLEVGERMIRSYRDDLELAGIYVESATGKNGGYFIRPGRYMKLPALTELERGALADSVNQLLESDTFILKKDLRTAVEKILADQPALGQPGGGTAGELGMDSRLYIRDDKTNAQEAGTRDVYLDFNAAIIEKRKLRIRYYSNSSEVTERTIRPYGLVAYRNAWYCIAHCELRSEIRAFKLARMQGYEALEERFTVPADFDIKKHVGDFRLMKGEKIRLVLRVDPPLANHVNERIWGEDQEAERLENGGILLSVSVEDTPELTGWILSLGKAARVIAPDGVRRRLRGEIETMARQCAEPPRS